MVPKQLTVILFLSYFAFGTLCLPKGNFSFITELPAMYKHCKSTEDKDMTPIDFITDHLINIDGIFDNHDYGDEQKPHSSFPAHHLTQMVFCSPHPFNISFVYHVEIRNPNLYPSGKFIPSEFVSGIFRPPIV